MPKTKVLQKIRKDCQVILCKGSKKRMWNYKSGENVKTKKIKLSLLSTVIIWARSYVGLKWSYNAAANKISKCIENVKNNVSNCVSHKNELNNRTLIQSRGSDIIFSKY